MCEEKDLIITQDFKNDTALLASQFNCFLKTASPFYMVSNENIKECLENEPNTILEGYHFFKISSCMTENVEDLAEYLQEKIEKLYTALYALNTPIIYGIITENKRPNLVIGTSKSNSDEVVKPILEGLLSGVEITSYVFKGNGVKNDKGGVLSGVPSLEINEEKQKFDISVLMRSMIGMDYCVLFASYPCHIEKTQELYGELLTIRDNCFAVSKRNIATQKSTNKATTITETVKSSPHTFSLILWSYNKGKNTTEAVSETIGESETTSLDIQNGIALEMIDYCDKAIDRLKQGQSQGFWTTAIGYSSPSEVGVSILRSCLSGEIAKPSIDLLPIKTYDVDNVNGIVPLPKLNANNPLLAPMTSGELAMISTPPFESVPDFELKKGKVYPLISTSNEGVEIGYVSDSGRVIKDMPFCLSEKDLNKHTFICGITGSGKTTTVKGILTKCKKAFMVIESAKKEYRNIKLDDDRKVQIFTLGKTELNCPQFNPFYIQEGINLQTHIDYLKDLFNASFSFYGPMPYILEKCLHNVYANKGWNLTLGYHPFLINTKNSVNLFDDEYMSKQYENPNHKFLYPTMQDLKDEVKRYIENEMQYEGEVAGNVKTAMLARLESLCVGSKGFMLNTHNYMNMSEIMKGNTVYELEGLADDTDKAFCVGLLVIFVNEYRQVFKEKSENTDLGLQHLLVIEEAHRLLKNVETEKTSENLGNPKGKAVEHFTNMLAEMRSYGQGVIIAEQIPSKLAPDVIKNSSNKIIQRVVSSDDQELVANTIGITDEDAVYIGGLKTGYGLCHKEGMSLPVCVKINPITDVIQTDGMLYDKRQTLSLRDISFALVQENTSDITEEIGLKLLNTILIESDAIVSNAINASISDMELHLAKKSVGLVVVDNDKRNIIIEVLCNSIISYLCNGVYKTKGLPSSDLYSKLNDLFKSPNDAKLNDVLKVLKKNYNEDCKTKGLEIVSELIKFSMTKNTDVRESAKTYFYAMSEATLEDIENVVSEEV